MAVKWGATAGSGNGQACVGIEVILNTTATQVERIVNIWLWTRYRVQDTNNNLYYDCGASVSAATTNKGAVSISTPSNSSWATANQKLLKTYVWTYTRGSSPITERIYTKLSGVDFVGATMYCDTSYTIPALDTYTIEYDGNGGTGAPGKQTKTYGANITLSETEPTYEGHTFLGWSTSSTATSASYKPGDSYTANANLKLYAVWTNCEYVLTLDANGGTVEESTIGFEYTSSDIADLSGNLPEKYGYKFLGWFTAASGGTKTHGADGKCINDGTYFSNNTCIYTGSFTLYAHWELTATLIVGDKKPAMPRVFIDGEWKKAYAHIFKNGKWNTGIT